MSHRRLARIGVAPAIAMVAGCVAALAPQLAGGAQVNFAFEGTIADVPANYSALNLPFSLMVGQKFNGHYSFGSETELFDVIYGAIVPKQGSISVSLGGSVGTAPVNRGSAGDVGLGDPPNMVIGSSLTLSYASPTDAIPGWTGEIGGQAWSASLTLVGFHQSLDTAQRLADVNNWNALNNERRLQLLFGYHLPNRDFQEVIVSATVGEFLVVPEPKSAVVPIPLAALAAPLFVVRRR